MFVKKSRSEIFDSETDENDSRFCNVQIGKPTVDNNQGSSKEIGLSLRFTYQENSDNSP